MKVGQRPYCAAVAVVSLAASLLGVVGCAKTDRAETVATAGSAVPAAAGPGSSEAPAAKAPAPPTCAVEAEKVWAADANPVAGISETGFDVGRVAFGVMLGGRPEVVVFDAKGEGAVKHVGVKKALTDAIAKGAGRRAIHRVTPAVGPGGEVIAFVDYDQIGKEHRTVACGPSDSANELLKFDGKPLRGLR